MSELIGHLHPALVHLPIGILLIALLLQWLARKEKYKSLQQAVPIALLWGAITALASSITGYILSTTDDYDKTLLTWHMWMGFATTLVAFMLYAKEKNPQFAFDKKILSIGLLVFVFVTGHLGGSLTHGSDYYTKPLHEIFSNDTSTSTSKIKPIPNAQEAKAYSDVIKPILQTKCYACHGPNKQKGGLRMDDSLKLLKGGKDGIVIDLNNPDASEMIKRLLLPVDDEDHMPPKEKSQPTESQIALLHWWITNNADLHKKVKELPQPEKIKPMLLALQKATVIQNQFASILMAPVEKPDATAIEHLKEHGAVIMPVAQNSNYLMANFVTDTLISNDDLQSLLALKTQLIWLNLAGTNSNDASMKTIAQLTNLRKLNLSNTLITDNALQLLTALQHLQYLNLFNTKVTAAGLLQLKNIKTLQSLYLYKTNISAAEQSTLTTAFPKAHVDFGGYTVATFATDTTEVKVKKEY